MKVFLLWQVLKIFHNSQFHVVCLSLFKFITYNKRIYNICKFKFNWIYKLMINIDIYQYLMGNGNKAISKNYTIPQEFLIKQNQNRGFLKSLGKQSIQNPKNNIPPNYRCNTFSFNNNGANPQIYQQNNELKLRILTYNVWFQSNNVQNRVPNLIRLIKDSDADFICLQEVTQQFINALRQSKLFVNYYIGQYGMHWYDTIILSKYKCINYKIPFDKSTMNRSLLISELQIQNQSILISSVHLQSLMNTQLRIQQLKQIFYYLSWASAAVFVGDLNFTDGAQENYHISKEYQDLFLYLYPNQNGSTMLKTPKYSQWRPDHILVKGINLQKSKLRIIGDFTIPPYQHQKITNIELDGTVRTPSDHLGLLCQLPYPK